MSEKSTWRKRITAALAAGALLVTLPLSGCNNTDKGGKNESKTSQTVSETTEKVPDTKFGDGIVAQSKTYKIKYYGWREGFNNGVPNILSISEVINETGTKSNDITHYMNKRSIIYDDDDWR